MAGAPAETRGGELLSGRRKQRGSAALARLAQRRRENARDGFLHDDSADARLAASSAVPYSVEYQGELARAAALLREAAAADGAADTEDDSSRRAPTRSSSNDYYASDVAWMELDASIEPTIGPYEVYEDEWFNFKAAFEAFITIRDDAETKKLQSFSAHLQELENALPIDPQVPQSEARRARADPRRQRRVHGRRCQPRRADRRVQSPRTTNASSRRRAPSA